MVTFQILIKPQILYIKKLQTLRISLDIFIWLVATKDRLNV